jgi:predicted amidohydrolase
MRAAAIQLEAVPADVDANLAATERLVGQAAAAGATVIAMPEFFTTGIGFLPELADAALPPEGKATELLLSLA